MADNARSNRLSDLEQRLDRVAGMGVRLSYDDIEALGGPSRHTILRKIKAGTWPPPIKGSGARFRLDEVRAALDGRWPTASEATPGRSRPRR
jgi:predicted DNA-binding transcriptional regulator AlpA